MPLLSLVVITQNEEKNLARCLESARGVVDEVVVVDSFSTDQTRSIAAQYQAHFVERVWEGYSRTKNYANSLARYNWILSLDADEALSDELKKSILKLKEQPVAVTASFNRLTQYCGKWIHHCWYPDTKIRIFDRTETRWEGEIHETLVSNPPVPVVHLKGDCLHYSYYQMAEHIAQTQKFSTLSAEDLFRKGKKSSLINIYLSPAAAFIKTYLLKLGVLDGYRGLQICLISAWSVYLKYVKLKRLENS